MKTLFTFISICLTSSIILTSCGSVSITKRKHSNGYHVYYNNVKQSNNITKSDDEFLNRIEKNKVSDLPQKKNEFLTLSEEETSSQTDQEVDKTKSENSTDETKNDGLLKKKSKQKSTSIRKENKTNLAKEDHGNKSILDEFSLKRTTKKIKENITQSKNSKASAQSETALSLFWIVILIILILWLLGFIGGIGEIIHLLLVVALILLILWLLRVI